MISRFIALSLLLGLFAGPSGAQTAPAQAAGSTATTASAQDDRVPVPEPTAKAMRYYQTGTVLWWVRTLWGFAVPVLFLFTGFSARLRDAATGWSESLRRAPEPSFGLRRRTLEGPRVVRARPARG